MPDPAEGIAFEPDLSPETNVNAFIDHLATRDPDLAALLQDNISILLEAGEGAENNARREFNRLIAEALDAPASDQEGESP